MYVGTSEEETYSYISAHTSGSYYDTIKERVIRCANDVLDTRLKEGCCLLTVADFGTADGLNFIPLIEDILRVVDKKTDSSYQTMFYFNDRIDNDFNLLFSHMEKTDSHFMKKRNVFFSVIGKSMYGQCLPNDSLDVAVSTVSLHWLSETPCPIENGLEYYNADTKEQAMFQDKARSDWRDFLLSRGKELKQGGGMVLLIPTVDESNEGRLYDAFSKTWRNMFYDKKIEKDEFRKTTLPMFISRTEEDIRLPFEDSEVCCLGMRLVSIEKFDHCVNPLMSLKETYGKERYAQALVNFVRPWLRNVLFEGLSDNREPAEKERIVDEFFVMLLTVLLEYDVYFSKITMTEVVIKKRKQQQ